MNRTKEFINYCKVARRLSEGTCREYARALACLVDHLKNKPLEKADPSDFISILAQDFDKKLSASTINLKRAAWIAYFDFCCDFYPADGYSLNPARKIARAKQPKRLIKSIDLETLETFVADIPCWCDDMKMKKAYLSFLLHTGLRASELCNLQKANILFDKNCISVIGKGNKQRLVPLCKAARHALEDALKLNHTSSFVFIGSDGNKLTYNEMWIDFKVFFSGKIEESLNHPHTFRHSFATYLVKKGISLFALQSILGHSEITTTAIYIHSNPESISHEIQLVF